MTLRIDGIADGAGNTTAAYDIPIKVDLKNDKAAPSWLPVDNPANVLFLSHWAHDGSYGPFKPASYNKTAVVAEYGAEPFLRTHSYTSTGSLALSLKWKVADHPYLTLRLRRPKLVAKSEISLYFRGGSKKFTIPLTGSAKASSSVLPLPQPLEWKEGEWTTIIVNVHELIKKHYTDSAMHELTITGMTFNRSGTPSKHPLDIGTVAVLAPYAADHVVTLAGYDASGVSGTQWRQIDAAGKVLASGAGAGLTATPAKLGLKPGPGWLEYTLKDRAGNESTPFRLPVLK
jgi:hypothetical protein